MSLKLMWKEEHTAAQGDGIQGGRISMAPDGGLLAPGSTAGHDLARGSVTCSRTAAALDEKRRPWVLMAVAFFIGGWTSAKP